MANSKNPRFTSPAGTAVYPYLNQPDTKFDAAGVYKTKLSMPIADAESLMAQLEDLHKQALADAKKANSGKRIKEAELPFLVNEEDGTVAFSLKLKAKVTPKNGKPFEQVVALFDAKGAPLSRSVKIGGGSTIKCAFEAVPFFAAQVGAGITLRLLAVQVLDLKTFGGASADAFGFGVEDGFDGSSVSATDDEQDTADAPAEDASDDADGDF